MKLTIKEKKTLNFYETHAEEWAYEIAYPSSMWANEIGKFHKLIPCGKIIEIGAGNGRDAEEFIKLGYDYVGTDISKELLNIAKKRNPKGKFHYQSVYELDFLKHSFDGFWACALFVHIPKDRTVEALKSIKGVMKTNSVGFISLQAGRDALEKSTGRYYFRYGKKEFTKFLKNAGFSVLETGEKRDQEIKTTWLTFFVNKQ